MHFGPILRALLHQRGRFVLISLEIALTLAIVANCLHLIGHERATIERPTGLDEANLLTVSTRNWGERFFDASYLYAVAERDLARLRAIPGVVAVTTINQFPLSGGGSATGRRAEGSELDTVTTPYFVVTPDGVATLGVELVAGRNLTADDLPPLSEDAVELESRAPETNVLLTQALAAKLFPDGEALGKRIASRDGTESNTVVGIVRRMHGSWPLSSVAEDVMLQPGLAAYPANSRFLVRVEPGALAAVRAGIEPALLEVEAERLVDLETMEEVKASTYGGSRAMIQMLSGVAVLLVFVTALGVVGLTAFSVTERTRQIGTRRALGATRGAILGHFLVENWLVTAAGLALGTVLAYALDLMLRESTGAGRLDLSVLVQGMLVLWLAGLLAALVPALRSTRVPPVVATRTV
jgi:putative ABC transport system permease protein